MLWDTSLDVHKLIVLNLTDSSSSRFHPLNPGSIRIDLDSSVRKLQHAAGCAVILKKIGSWLLVWQEIGT